MNKKIIILFVFALFISGCSSSYYDNAYNSGFSDGEDSGYEIGYKDGYNEGCSDTESKFSNSITENYIYENLDYYGIITIKDAMSEMSQEDRNKLVSLMSKYYDIESLYGYFVGDYSTLLLHSVDGPCFDKINYDNLVIFDGSLDYVLENTDYKKCECMK